jgi:hypothetical protein
MARFVMIQIDDNDEADAFVKAIGAYNVIYGTASNDADVTEISYKELIASIKAIWAVPTKFCECPDYPGVSVPSQKYRWMVHAKCGKPAKGAMMHPRDLSLPEDTPSNEIPFYLGMRADQRGWIIPRAKK